MNAPPAIPGHGPKGRIAPAPADAVVVTASYAPDLERCRLLCETIDRHVTGSAHHYLLVEGGDVALFRSLEGPKRTVVDERDILPSWLHCVSDPTSLFRRRIWLSLRTPPLRGWHVQQLRRIAIARHVDQSILVYCDSDVAFLKRFDLSIFRRNGRTRLFRRDGALAREGLDTHRIWSANAASVLGLPSRDGGTHDYISTLIAWDRKTVLAMIGHIEDRRGRPWVAAIASDRRYSECLIYGRYVDEVTATAGHFHGSEELCRVHWTGEPLSDDAFQAFVDTMSPEQVAIGMQSFIGTDVTRIRRLVGGP
jgi:hypothetical protein